ncbi:hypothetical protein ABW19_dt0210414 [Dactylella cylindrospora]|nr:hypothetical protein ABW19_dt0210414 [Dactylella cylindrospora]
MAAEISEPSQARSDAPASLELVPKRRWHLGILSDVEGGEVPGTVLFLDKGGQISDPESPRERGSRDNGSLKRASNGVILEPQPDDYDGDPLNWPKWRREAALWTIGIYSLVGGGQTPILAAGFNDVAKTFSVTVPQVALTTGIYMLGLAIGVVIVSPFAILYGKRPLFLAGSVVFLATSIWSAASPSYASLVVARIIMGIGVSTVECLPSAYISEIFFLHERGFRLGIYTLFLLGGKNLVPLVSGVIIGAKDWRWVFWILAVIVGVLMVFLFVYVPETYYIRNAALPEKSSTTSGSNTTEELTDDELAKPEEAHCSQPARQDDTSLPAAPKKQWMPPAASPTDHGINMKYTRYGPKLSFNSQLRIWNRRLRNEDFWKAISRPMFLFAYPAILWSTVVYSLSVVWLIVLSETVAHIYQANPYNFSQLSTGLVYISPFVGGVLGSAIAGKLSDIIVKFMAKRNGGVYEPEFRLVMAIGVAIATSVGLMGFGWSAYVEDGWIVPTIFFGVISFGCSLGSTTAITFAVDSYREYAAEALVTLNFSKNILGLAFSLFWNDWLEASNPRTCFLVLGGIQLFCLLWTVPVYIYGKRFRAWTAKRNLMGKVM